MLQPVNRISPGLLGQRREPAIPVLRMDARQRVAAMGVERVQGMSSTIKAMIKAAPAPTPIRPPRHRNVVDGRLRESAGAALNLMHEYPHFLNMQ